MTASDQHKGHTPYDAEWLEYDDDSRRGGGLGVDGPEPANDPPQSSPHSMSAADAIKTLRQWDHLGTANRLYYKRAIDSLEEQFEARGEAIFWLLQGYDDAVFASSRGMARWAARARDLIADSNPATEAGNVPKSADAPASVPARVPHQGDYEPPEVDDWRPGDYRLSYPASEPKS